MAPEVTLKPTERLAALAVAGTLAAPLVVACTLVPDASGMGTHRQLGLPACGWPMAFGLPCITCGMTTAFANAVHGRFVAAAWSQPAGLLLAVACALGVVVCTWDALSGRPVHRMLAPLAAGRTAWFAGFALAAAWGWKVLQCRGMVA
jgi:hypothetical protein